MTGYWVMFGIFMPASMIVGGILKQKFSKYSKVSLGGDYSGR